MMKSNSVTIYSYLLGCTIADSSLDKYSSFRCLGGAQAMDTNSMKQATFKKFPLNDPEHRTCLFNNVCIVNGSMTFFQRPIKLPDDYTPVGFDNGNIFHTGHLRGFTINVKTIYGSMSSINSPFIISENLTFLDANSWTFNYGHYLIDNVIPTFTAAKVFNLPFTHTQQLMETNCQLFSTLEPAFSNKRVAYNHSMGTYRQACLDKLDRMWSHFFDNPPLYLDQIIEASKAKNSPPNKCFRNLIAGQGSTFGLKSLDLTRAIVLRDFREFVLTRLGIPVVNPKREKVILVGLRVAGSAGGALISDLCGIVKNALQHIAAYKGVYRVECIYPSDLSFKDEIIAVRKAKVLVSVHGTITYMSLFSCDNTQQISLASPKELKENQILLYATHFNTIYLTWNRMQQLSSILEHAIVLAEQSEH